MSNKFNKNASMLAKPKVCKKPPPPPPPPPGPETGLLFWDQFNDAPGTLLENHEPDVDTIGEGWIPRYGKFTIDGTRAMPPPWGPQPGNEYFAEMGQGNVVIYNWVNTGNPGSWSIGPAWGLSPVGHFQIVDVYVGTKRIRHSGWPGWWQDRGQWSEPSLAPNQDVLITVRLLPGLCTCQLNDGEVHVMQDAYQETNTTAGIYAAWINQIAQLDLRVENLNIP